MVNYQNDKVAIKSSYSDPVAHGQIPFCQYKHTWGKVYFISLNFIYSSCTAKNSGITEYNILISSVSIVLSRSTED